MSAGATVPFRDVLQFAIGGGWGSEDPGDEHIPVAIVRGTDLAGVRSGDLKTVPRRFERASKVERRRLQPGDIVLEIAGGSPSSGQSTGRTAFITHGLLDQAGLPLIPASFCRLVRLNADLIDPRYGYYALQEMYSSGRARNYENQSTGIANFQFERFLDFEEVRLPPIEEQRAIASVLGALDDKIGLNRRMNETLEALARAIFTSWFVDFDPVRAKAEGRQPVGMDAETTALFPDAFADSPLGPIPSGWQALPLDRLATFLNGLALQRYPPTGVGDLPAIKIPELRAGVTSSTGRASADVPEQYVVADGDVLFSWSGSLVAVLWAGGIGALNQHLFRVTSNEYPRWLYYFWIREHLETFRQIAAGKATTMGHIQRGHLSQADCIVPPMELLRRTSDILEPMLDAIVSHGVESRSMTAIRDALLPKLVSGEIRIAADA